jgi:CheY-like chemotaxis protein
LNNNNLIKILHVDDEEHQLKFVKIFLEDIDPDMMVESLVDPKKALEILSSDDYDAVLSDYKMNHMTGIEFAEHIRSFTDIPIILYTGFGSEEIAEQAFRVGIDDYVTKRICPSHYNNLAERIRKRVELYNTRSFLSSIKDSSLQFSITR